MKELIINTLEKIHGYERTPDPDRRLPQGSFFLDDKRIVCTERSYGESRYPYDRDGLVIWAHSDGYIDACESLFNVFRNAMYNEDTPVCFWGGLPEEEGRFCPVSVTGAAKQGGEPRCIKRYVVYDLRSALYITETPAAAFGVRVHISKDKHIHFSLSAVNTSENERDIYLCAYFEAMLRYIAAEDFFNRMTKYAERLENGSVVLKCRNAGFDCLTVNHSVAGKVTKSFETVAKKTFLGFRGGNLTNANALFSGHFTEEIKKVNTTDTPVSCDMVHFSIPAGGEAKLQYELIITHSEKDAIAAAQTAPDENRIERELREFSDGERAELNRLKISFGKLNSGKMPSGSYGEFIENLKKQVSFCALGKNYAGPLLGIRDVYQQLESVLLWKPQEAREKIVSTLDFILSDGRAPRQVSFPPDKNTLPELDLRPYIDQGLWIISTVYTYLCFTGDFSILDEECSYYNCEKTYGPLSFCDDRTTVLEHLVRITDYLVSHIDSETHCLHALYGDWNDALDGLGRTNREGCEFGTGVTVMATLQFYRNLEEISEIIKRTGKYTGKLEGYAKVRDGIREGLLANAVDTNEAGEKRIIHGWGDLSAYKVGSFCDYDGQARRSLVANSFWSICGMLDAAPETRDCVIEAFRALDSGYGMKTFDRYFRMFSPEVGRISTITPGTYENSCVYVHASTFAVMALFAAGEPALAWEQLEKLAVISHENATLTTFVMPNSYCEAPEYEIDGDSMGDWYTGSGTVYVKALVRYGFGIQPDLDGLRIALPAVMPSSEASIEINIRGRRIALKYRNTGKGSRRYIIDGKETETVYDKRLRTLTVYIPADGLNDGMTVEIED